MLTLQITPFTELWMGSLFKSSFLNGHLAYVFTTAAIKYWMKLSRAQKGSSAFKYSWCTLFRAKCRLLPKITKSGVRLSFLSSDIYCKCVCPSSPFQICGDGSNICCVSLSTSFRMGMATSMSRSWTPCYETSTRKTRRWDAQFLHAFV